MELNEARMKQEWSKISVGTVFLPLDWLQRLAELISAYGTSDEWIRKIIKRCLLIVISYMEGTGFGAAAPTPLVRLWRTAFLTLRDETLTVPPRNSTAQLLDNLIFSHSDALLSAAAELPSHEVSSSSSQTHECLRGFWMNLIDFEVTWFMFGFSFFYSKGRLVTKLRVRFFDLTQLSINSGSRIKYSPWNQTCERTCI